MKLYEIKAQFLCSKRFLEFKGISFDPDDHAAYLPYISVTALCYAANFHYAERAIYFTDDRKNVIGRVNTDGSGLEYVITHGLMRPHGIAVDWVGEQLYWTDMGTKLIEVRVALGELGYRMGSPLRVTLYYRKGHALSPIVILVLWFAVFSIPELCA
jgi:hypothetical protein